MTDRRTNPPRGNCVPFPLWVVTMPSMARQPDFRETVGSMTVGRRPRTTENRPHVADLGFHYGTVVASNRHSQIWLFGGRAINNTPILLGLA